MSSQAPPGRTGVRIAGDSYQWLHAWRACVQVLRDTDPAVRPPNPGVAVGIEVDDAGNVDDVVLYRSVPPHEYSQVKYAVDASSPVGTAYLTAATNSGKGPNLLQKFVAAHQTLAEGGQPAILSLITNRVTDPTSVLMTGRDARTGLLLPRAAEQGPSSRRGRERREWAAAAGVSEPALIGLLDVLRFHLGHDVQLLHDHVSLLMSATGLRSDAAAVQAGASWVQQQVIAGVRALDVRAISAGVADLSLEAGHAWPTVSIATLKPDPLAAEAVATIDWVDRFEGMDAYSRRRPAPPATWQELAHDIDTLPGQVVGNDSVLITGSMRLATGFKVGTALRRVTGVHVAVRQGSQIWHSEETYDQPRKPAAAVIDIGQGPDVAVVVEVAAPATPDVVDWVRDTGLPVDHVLTLRPSVTGAHDQAVADGSDAVALATGIRDAVRNLRKTHRQVHLFLAGPLGLAVLLGHRWNRVGPTVVYEDLVADGYVAAFDIRA